MKNRYSVIFLIILFAVFFLGYKFFPRTKNPFIKINGQTILIEIAQTPQEKSQGLSDKEFMADDRGMLFIHSRTDFHPFWMNRMKFNLDFVFIDKDLVVDLAENISFPKAGQKPQTVTAKKPFNKALEINAGIIEKLNIKIGDRVSFY